MPIVHSAVDGGRRRIELVSELAGTPAAVWELWASPRRLARWWGPPGAAMEVEHHDLRPGGAVRFRVRTPAGDEVRGAFAVHRVEAPGRLGFTFTSDGGVRADVDVRIDALDEGRSRMTLVVELPSDDAVEHVLAIGFDRGLVRSLATADEALRA